MTVNLPTGFDEWPQDAQEHFLQEARNKRDIVELIIAEYDGFEPEETIAPNGHLNQKMLIELWYHVTDL